MISTRFTLALLAAGALAGAALAQPSGATRSPDLLDVSAENFEVFEAEGRALYSGDVNAVRGDARLRADRVNVFFRASETGAFETITRLVAEGEVYYVTEGEVAHGDAGVYDVENDTIVLTGDVVLTQGCNVSTGRRLVANLTTGVSRLEGAGEDETGGRVRSIFFPDAQTDAPQRECEMPTPPGDGPQPFDGE